MNPKANKLTDATRTASANIGRENRFFFGLEQPKKTATKATESKA